MLEFSNQTEFLFHVEATDCIKAHKKWRTTLHPLQAKGNETRKSWRGKKKAAHTIVKSTPSQNETKLKSPEASETSKMSWMERKRAFKDCKQMLNKSMKSWSDSDSSFSSEEGDAISVPSNFKRYTIEDQKIKLQKPQRIKPQQFGESYDGPEDAKLIDLANAGESPKPVYIATDLLPEEEELLIIKEPSKEYPKDCPKKRNSLHLDLQRP